MAENRSHGQAPPNRFRSGFLGAVSEQPVRFTPANARRALLDLVPTEQEMLEMHGVTDWPAFVVYMLRRIEFRMNYHYGVNPGDGYTFQDYINTIEEQS